MRTWRDEDRTAAHLLTARMTGQKPEVTSINEMPPAPWGRGRWGRLAAASYSVKWGASPIPRLLPLGMSNSFGMRRHGSP